MYANSPNMPRVILHNVVSVDGRVDWFEPDIGQFYSLASRWNGDVTLAGTDTILGGFENDAPTAADLAGLTPQNPTAGDTRPILAIPDSRGRIQAWHSLREAPYWSRVVALCSGSTPERHLDLLDACRVDRITIGEDHVDLKAALQELGDRYSAKTVRVDSGGTLNRTSMVQARNQLQNGHDGPFVPSTSCLV